MSGKPTCETCPYWTRYDEQDPEGLCQRYPPAMPNTESQVREDGDSGLFHGWFPEVHKLEWCGEHPDFPAYLAAHPSTPPAEKAEAPR